MIHFPNCKINLGLNIIRKRPDGFHEIETVFYPLPFIEVLEALPSGQFQFNHSGLPIPGNEKTNLCIRAWIMLKEDHPELPELQIWLHKHIPIGSGLGGGSADAVSMLKMVDELFGLGLPGEQIFAYALRLGSDCPFFLSNKPCLARGRGELFETIPLDLSGYSFLLVNSGIHVDTAWAFSQSSPALPSRSLKEIILQAPENWKSLLLNDFEKPVLRLYPALNAVKEKLYEAGAIYASMTGSGSSFYGIFRKNALPSISFEENFSTLIIS
jgi:4-diphosphocytidyl-2-C-methyl-D-erythritol kinase